jgi:hypothetical protein
MKRLDGPRLERRTLEFEFIVKGHKGRPRTRWFSQVLEDIGQTGKS